MKKWTKIVLTTSLIAGGVLYSTQMLQGTTVQASEISTRSTQKYPSKEADFYVKADNNAVTFDSFNFDEHHIKHEHDFNLSDNEQYIVKRVYDLSKSEYYGMKDIYSIYSRKDGKDTWLGYGSPDYFQKLNRRGQYMANDSSNQYVKVSHSNYNLIQNLETFKVKASSKEGATYVAKGHYNHGNGQTYQSLYRLNKDDNELTWQGYINDKALTHLADDFGSFHKVNNGKIKITKSNYGVYKDKNFKKKVGTSGQFLNKTLIVKGYYDRFSKHERYVSLYNGDQWLGYVQIKAGTVNFK